MNGESSELAVREVVTSHAAYSRGVRCAGGGCPAVYQREDGAFFIIGRRLADDEKAGLPMDAIEDAVEVPAELLAMLVAARSK